ncbi:MAG: DUF983 domain-containing protein [Cyclobacteriaceae bacterium]|nr:DUF983 domain-containing protein [Cyclobacteriaceae bacterium]
MKMPERCEVCGLRYELEPAFFYGALYVSHALHVAWMTAAYIALRVLFNPPTDVYILVMFVGAAIMLPMTLRLARTIYINFFILYRGAQPPNRIAEGHQG